ncbi:Small-conductance mechanosensitive channel [Chitinophaga eiseniae]|uniref:Small-conductance mechanosensitive channel n=1 Tax=Chitinophaga eiseniae TaxID=634771 RepID=A0A1T4SWZ6_9BACT|nr:mechanosensitive ion channel family protein [Chitinophaga eiseniae]SKA32682.1 Small-conductance mechanosensitive channel [Chitinophaga eiseniae]
MNNYLHQSYLGNTISAWLVAASIIVAALIVIRVFAHFVLKRISGWVLRTKTTWDNFLVEVVRSAVVPALYISSVYIASTTLVLPGGIVKVLHTAYLMVLTYYGLRTFSSAFRKFIHSYIQSREGHEGKGQHASGLIIVANIVIWTLGILFLIDNLGYNVTTLVAGLGIGGIAIALAAQAILGDLFSYFVIFFDRPFEIGDFVVVDDKSGTIEHIGIKTTRIRTLGGEQLVCSNTDLANARLHNYKRLERRRVLFTLGVIYQTRHDQLKRIPELVRQVIEQKTQVQFDRGHFSNYGDCSLNFEFVYYILDSSYNVYMDKQQEIYLDIFKAFTTAGIEFAYPTQTVFIDPSSLAAVAGTK